MFAIKPWPAIMGSIRSSINRIMHKVISSFGKLGIMFHSNIVHLGMRYLHYQDLQARARRDYFIYNQQCILKEKQPVAPTIDPRGNLTIIEVSDSKQVLAELINAQTTLGQNDNKKPNPTISADLGIATYNEVVVRSGDADHSQAIKALVFPDMEWMTGKAKAEAEEVAGEMILKKLEQSGVLKKLLENKVEFWVASHNTNLIAADNSLAELCAAEDFWCRKVCEKAESLGVMLQSCSKRGGRSVGRSHTSRGQSLL